MQKLFLFKIGHRTGIELKLIKQSPHVTPAQPISLFFVRKLWMLVNQIVEAINYLFRTKAGFVIIGIGYLVSSPASNKMVKMF